MYRSLIVPLDGSTFAEQALPIAGAILRRSKASLTLVRVHRPLGYGDEAPAGTCDGDLREWERDYLARAATQVTELYGVKVDTTLLEEPVVPSLCDYVRARDADLVIMSTHGRTGVSRAWLGSVADGVVRQVSVPVLMFRGREDVPIPTPGSATDHFFERMLLPLDGSRLSEAIVGHAVRLARTFASEIVLLRVVEPIVAHGPEYPLASPVPITLFDRDTMRQLQELAEKYLEEIAERLRREHDLKVRVDVRMFESAARAIIDAGAVERAELVAMSTHGRGASRLLVGSVADKVLRAGPHTVLLFRPIQE